MRGVRRRLARTGTSTSTRDMGGGGLYLLAVDLRASTVPPGGLVITFGIGGGIGGAK